MTLLAVVAAAAVLLALPGAFDRFGRRIPQREWTWLCTVGLGGGLALLEAVLVLRAAPTVLRAAGVAWLASACERVLRPLVAGGPAMGWGAGAAAVALPAAALVHWWRGRRVRDRLVRDLWLGETRPIAGHAVVVLPLARQLAVSVDHNGTMAIIVSEGLLRVLDPAQVEAVVRHEAAHLRHRHQRMLTLAGAVEAIFGGFPPVVRSAAALRLTVERWADEEAADHAVGGRRAVRDSLLVLVGVAPATGLAGFTDAATVAARLAALESPPPAPPSGRHLMLYVPGSVAGAVAAPALVTWGGHVNMVLAMAGRCPA